MEELSNYADFYVWADEKICSTVEKISNDDYNRIIDGTDRSIRDLILHVISMYDFFFAAQTGIPYDQALENASKLSRSGLIDYWKDIITKFSNFIKSNKKESYNLPVGPGKLASISALDWFLLFTDHSSYHRGQLITFLKISGNKGVATDYLKYIIAKINK